MKFFIKLLAFLPVVAKKQCWNCGRTIPDNIDVCPHSGCGKSN